MEIKWRHRQHCEWSRQQHVLLYVIKWQMIRFQALWKTKSFVKVCLKFKLPLWTKGLLIHLSPLWQLPLWLVPRWHNFPVYRSTVDLSLISHYTLFKGLGVFLLEISWRCPHIRVPNLHDINVFELVCKDSNNVLERVTKHAGALNSTMCTHAWPEVFEIYSYKDSPFWRKITPKPGFSLVLPPNITPYRILFWKWHLSRIEF